MEIRTMAEKDLQEVSALEQQIFSKPWSLESFRSAFDRADTIYLVAEEKGHICGYLGIWMGPEDGDLCNIAMAPEYRGQGHAGRLLKIAIEQCKRQGLKRIILEVRLSNETAKRLYQKFSFQTSGVRQGYYSEPVEDALIMECSLSAV